MSDCIETKWLRNKDGYGIRSGILHHRMVAGVKRGDGSVVRHTCDNPPCINLSHLVVGTQKENLADMTDKGRRTRGESHHNAKLSDVKIDAIKRLYATRGFSQQCLADAFGVSQQSVGLWCANKRRTP